MPYERNTDRMAGALLQALMGSMSNPLNSAGIRPQVDEGSMLNTIKDFLSQSMPGAKGKEDQSTPTASEGSWSGSGTSAAGEVQVGGWEGLFRRQGQERDAMHVRHVREREEMNQRHVKEMEAATSGQTSSAATREVVRPQPRTLRSSSSASTRRRVRGTGGF